MYQVNRLRNDVCAQVQVSPWHGGWGAVGGMRCPGHHCSCPQGSSSPLAWGGRQLSLWGSRAPPMPRLMIMTGKEAPNVSSVASGRSRDRTMAGGTKVKIIELGYIQQPPHFWTLQQSCLRTSLPLFRTPAYFSPPPLWIILKFSPTLELSSLL